MNSYSLLLNRDDCNWLPDNDSIRRVSLWHSGHGKLHATVELENHTSQIHTICRIMAASGDFRLPRLESPVIGVIGGSGLLKSRSELF